MENNNTNWGKINGKELLKRDMLSPPTLADFFSITAKKTNFFNYSWYKNKTKLK